MLTLNLSPSSISISTQLFVTAPAGQQQTAKAPKGQRDKYIGILKSGQNYRINRFDIKINTDVKFNFRLSDHKNWQPFVMWNVDG
jgi:hypothetical protein